MEDCPKARSHEEQQAIKPNEAVTLLRDGNARFVADDMIKYCYKEMAETTAVAEFGQNPFAAVVACVDSRMPVETIFDQAIGDMFVARVAGNFVNTDIIGSLEFAVASGVKTILILGHTSCGAVKGACDGGATGHVALDSMLANIEPAVRSVSTSTGKEGSSKDPEFVQAVSDRNVKMAMDTLRAKSGLIDGMIRKDELTLVGGMYNLATRVVTIN
jgi:carbonic anhydrase